MFRKPVVSGGRHGARRFLLALPVVWIGALPAVPLAGNSVSQPQVSVREQAGLYAVHAEFEVPQSGSAVLAVLTDYEDIPRFMPGLKSSIVRERSAERVVVEQEAVSRMMMFSKRIHLLLEVNERSDALLFRDCAGRSFETYEGAWRLTEREGQTVIRYELRARPTFDVPEFLLRRLLARDAKAMIEGLRREIATRQVAASAVTRVPVH